MQMVWVAFYYDDDWVRATILELRDTEALVQEQGTDREEWVPLSRVFDVGPRA